jgi:hypothetical protein
MRSIVLLGLVIAGKAGADSQTLAKENLAGTVHVPEDATLYRSRASAENAAAVTSSGSPIAMRVVKDHGEFVELATGNVTDCLTSYQHDYDLTVFVRRSTLLVRSGKPIVKDFKDGTAVAIDAGAPVTMTSSGPSWRSKLLSSTGVTPDAKQLRYSIAKPAEAALPAAPGERMVCEDHAQTHAEWKRSRERKAEEAKRENERKLEQEREACRARQASKPKKKKVSKDPRESAILDVLGGSDECSGIGVFGGSMTGLGIDGTLHDRYAPWCSASDHSGDTRQPEPLLGGKRIPWLLNEVDVNSDVYLVGSKYYADLGVACGRVRVGITATSHGSRLGIGSLGGGKNAAEWTFEPGPVTWPDGSPAGRLVSRQTYRTFEERKGKICVDVPHVAERVCHAKKNGTLRK